MLLVGDGTMTEGNRALNGEVRRGRAERVEDTPGAAGARAAEVDDAEGDIGTCLHVLQRLEPGQINLADGCARTDGRCNRPSGPD